MNQQIAALNTCYQGPARMRRLRVQERGQALVEFSVTLPLMLLVMMGICECGILLNNWIVLTEAVRSGTRELSIGRIPNTDACDRATTLIKSSASSLDTSKIAVSYTVNNSCTNLAEGSMVTVSATYPCRLSILGVDYAPGCSLRAQTTGRVE